MNEFHLLVNSLDDRLARLVVKDINMYPRSMQGMAQALFDLWKALIQSCSGTHLEDRVFRMRNALVFDPRKSIDDYIESVENYIIAHSTLIGKTTIGNREACFILREGLKRSHPRLYLDVCEKMDLDFLGLCVHIRSKATLYSELGLIPQVPLHDTPDIFFGSFKKPQTKGKGKGKGLPTVPPKLEPPSDHCWRCWSSDHPSWLCESTTITQFKNRCKVCGKKAHTSDHCPHAKNVTCTSCSKQHYYWMCPDFDCKSKLLKIGDNSSTQARTSSPVPGRSKQVGVIQLMSTISPSHYEFTISTAPLTRGVGKFDSESLNLLNTTDMTPTIPVASVPPTVLDCGFVCSNGTTQVRCLFDDGCDVDLLSEETLQDMLQVGYRLKLSELKDFETESIRLGDNHKIKVTRYGSTILCIPLANGQVWRGKVNFLVCPGLIYDYVVSRVTLSLATLNRHYTPGLITEKRPAVLSFNNIGLSSFSPKQFVDENSSPKSEQLSIPESMGSLPHEVPPVSAKPHDSDVFNHTLDLSANVNPTLRQAAISSLIPEVTCSWLNVPSGFSLVRTVKVDSWFCICVVEETGTSKQFYLVDVSDDFYDKLTKPTPTKRNSKWDNIHPKLFELKNSNPGKFSDGISLLNGFFNDGKLHECSPSSSATNFYCVLEPRTRPVFPFITVNKRTAPFLKTTNFSQNSIFSIIQRLRCYQHIETADISDAFMSIRLSDKLSSILVLDLRGVEVTGSPVDFAAFSFMPYGWSAAPCILECCMSDSMKQFKESILLDQIPGLPNRPTPDGAKIGIQSDTVSCDSPYADITGYMDDLTVKEVPFRLDEEKSILESLSPGVVVASDTCLLNPIMENCSTRNLNCKPSKIERITCSKTSDALGTHFFEYGSKMSYKKYHLLTHFPANLTYRNLLAYLAQLAPVVPELVPEFRLIQRNVLQKVIGLEVSSHYKSRNIKPQNASKTLRDEVWNTEVSPKLFSFATVFHHLCCSTYDSDFFVYRGLDLTLPISIYCDASSTCIGYYTMQNDRILWYNQNLVSKLSSSAIHINSKESLSIAYSLIDFVNRFRVANVKIPKVTVFNDSKTAVSIFRNLRVNSTASSDCIQRGLLTKIITHCTLILGEDFLRHHCSFVLISGTSNPADKLTRDSLTSDCLKYCESLCTDFENAELDTAPAPVSSTNFLLFNFCNFEPVSSLPLTPLTILRDTFSKTELVKYFNTDPTLPVLVKNFYILKLLFNFWKANKDSTSNFVSNFYIFAIDSYISELKSLRENCKSLYGHHIENFIVYRCSPESFTNSSECGRQLVLPEQNQPLKLFVAKRCHEISVHGKLHTTYSTMWRTFWCQKMKNICKKVCNDCEYCEILTTTKRSPYPSDIVREIPLNCFHSVSADLYGPLPLTKNQQVSEILLKTTKSTCPIPRFILTIYCFFSRFTTAIPVITSPSNGATAAAVRLAFLQFFSDKGYPNTLKIDNGSNLVTLTPWFEKCGITVIVLPPYTPYQNGGNERSHRELNKAIRLSVASGKSDWYQDLFDKILTLNTSKSNCPFSPAELVYKFNISLKNFQFVSTQRDLLVPYLSDSRIKSREAMLKKAPSKTTFEIGQFVRKFTPSSKYETTWSVPLKVLKINDDGSLLLSDKTRQNPMNVIPTKSLESTSPSNFW